MSKLEEVSIKLVVAKVYLIVKLMFNTIQWMRIVLEFVRVKQNKRWIY